MKYILLFLILITPLISSAEEYGENPANINCEKSIHRPRPLLETLKTEDDYSEESKGKEKEVQSKTKEK
jgi:hypothetical protein